MKFDKEKLRAYASLGDAELWGEIRKMASQYGYSLPDTAPPHSDMERIRNIMLGKEKISMSEGIKLLNNYKQKHK